MQCPASAASTAATRSRPRSVACRASTPSTVDLERKVVVVRGDALADAEIRAAIDEAGYDVEGPAA